LEETITGIRGLPVDKQQSMVTSRNKAVRKLGPKCELEPKLPCVEMNNDDYL